MPRLEKQFIAIDAGGTKTDVVWFEESGRIINRIKGKAANPNGLPYETVKANLQDIFQALFVNNKDFSRIKNVFAGFAGGSHPNEQHAIKLLLGDILPFQTNIKVDHDAINALWSGTHGKPGLVLIAGTGSIVFAITETYEMFRVGGWGYLVGDEGSGYDIGRKAVRAVLKAYDGRGERTLLTKLILDHLEVTTETDLIPTVYQGGKTLLASLVPLVVKAANLQDHIALEIIDHAAKELAELVQAGLQRFAKIPKDLVFVGGLQNIGEALIDSFNRHLEYKPLNIIFPTEPPVYGAAIECLLMENIQPTVHFTKNFTASDE